MCRESPNFATIALGTVGEVLHHIYESPKSKYVWRILEVILNQAGETIFINAEHAMFEFPEQRPNNPVNTLILFTKRFLYSSKFSGFIPNNNTLLRQVKEVTKVQIIKVKSLALNIQAGLG